MKLKLGENLRRLRKERELTQEQFSTAIGVSFQAVSRWENGTAYPDMELLPCISSFFGVSVDTLLGCPEAEKEEQAAALLNDLHKAASMDPFDEERAIALIRDFRRYHLNSKAAGRFWSTNPNIMNCYRSPAVLPEIRKTAELLLQKNRDSQTIWYMAMLEEEERLDAFLEEYATDELLTVDNLKSTRYALLKDHERYEPLKQRERFFALIQKVFVSWHDTRRPVDPEEALYVNDAQLSFLHAINRQAPDAAHPLSANGELDCFLEARLWLGVNRIAALAKLNRFDEALVVFEDAVGLLERLMTAELPLTLRSVSPWFSEIEWRVEEDCDTAFTPIGKEERFRWLVCGDTRTAMFPSAWYYNTFMNERFTGDAWMAGIVKDPRYIAIADRVKALIVTKA